MDRVEGRPNRTRNVAGQHISDPSPTTKSLLHILLRFLELVAGKSFNVREEGFRFAEDGRTEGK